MLVDGRIPVPNAGEEVFIIVDAQPGIQAALHENFVRFGSLSARGDQFVDFPEDLVPGQDVSIGGPGGR